ncbi:hypothetical protein [Chitinophaga japonensis]|uniref:Cytochrome B n=1 Tax=Chitinophaga japonensis TaxID=104662 RepID=A0A562T8G6_CHIJA|nr:hypothetical protein [Chitinophaga japonensis]TWI89236.1 hypothetical protein LX66_3330 [Chitinophaga japonensis]
MYAALIFLHSLFRWLVVISLAYAIFRACRGYISARPFTRTDNAVRHWTATIAHVQLMIGMTLYTQSPVVQYYWKHAGAGSEMRFYGLIHIFIMLTAIALLTVGSALAKRKPTDRERFRTMFTWFLLAFILIFIAIPWPFSPLSHRPYFR